MKEFAVTCDLLYKLIVYVLLSVICVTAHMHIWLDNLRVMVQMHLFSGIMDEEVVLGCVPCHIWKS